MSLRTCLGTLLGRERRAIVIVLTLALTASVWTLGPAAGYGTFSSNAFDPAADTTAILGSGETTDTIKGQIDDFDDGPYTVAYPDVPIRIAGMATAGPAQITKSREWDIFPHKTGPPAQS